MPAQTLKREVNKLKIEDRGNACLTYLDILFLCTFVYASAEENNIQDIKQTRFSLVDATDADARTVN